MPDEQPTPQAQPAAPRTTAADGGYRTQKWDRHDHYQCLGCPYDTFEELLMQQHQKVAHGRT